MGGQLADRLLNRQLTFAAAALGGWMMVGYGFAGFGPLATSVAVPAGALALVGQR